jgi:hypothetical protein
MCLTCKSLRSNMCPRCKERERVFNPSGVARYCLPCKLQINAEARARNPENHVAAMHRAKLKNKFGLSFEKFQAMIDAQNNLCAICKKPEQQRRRLSVDHDHETDAIRGLLCMNCNAGLGNLRDSIELLEAAAEYLRSYKVLENAMSGVAGRPPDDPPLVV